VVNIAVSGKEAVEAFHAALLQNTPYELICLDIQLPGFHGDEILQIIRRTERLRQTEKPCIIVMTSADHSSETVKRSLKMGCDGYLIKPFDLQHLLTLLTQKGLMS